MTFTLARAPCDHQQQGHGEIRRAVGQDLGRVGNGDGKFLRGGDIDVIEADPEVANHTHSAPFDIEQLGAEGIGDGRTQRIGAAQRALQLREAQGLVVGTQLDVEALRKFALDLRRPASCDDDFRLVHLVELPRAEHDGAAGPRKTTRP